MTLGDVKRFCNAHKACIECPLHDDDENCCLICHCPYNWNIDEIQRKMVQWLKDHPEPIYPTYYNWLIGEGINDFGQRIDPEFAEKYGIKPIE